MPAQNWHQKYITNPITTNQAGDLLYWARSPYGAGNDAVITWADFAAQFLLAINNLSDLPNVPQARTNLGLGSISTQAASAVAITGGTAILASLTVPYKYLDVAGNTNLVATNSNTIFTFTASAISLSDLLGLAAYANGFAFVLKNVSGGNVTFVPKAGEFIDGAASLTIRPQEGYVVIKTPTQWSIAAVNGIATNASNMLVTQVATNASFFPLFVASSSTGYQAVDVGTGLSFNPSTNTLSTTTFSGALSGNATTATSATTATNAINIGITNDTTTNATMFPLWVTANTGNLPAKVTSTKLFYNPSTSLLTNIGALGQITNIQSSAGLLALSFTYIASAVNNLKIVNATTGNGAQLAAEGSDSSIGIVLSPKNNVVQIVDSTATRSGALELSNANNTFATILTVATAQATNLTLILPAVDGSANFIMKTNGSGVLSLTNGSQVAGTATNDNASVGNIGEFISSIILSSSPVTLTSNATVNVASISLTAGDWDVWGNVNFISAGVAPTQEAAWTSTTSATPPNQAFYNSNNSSLTTNISANSGISAPYQRYSLSITTTVFLSAFLGNSSGNGSACGAIYARRAR
jgi:hypothetical protein